MFNSFLCQHPLFYRQLLSLRRPINTEKRLYLSLVRRGMNIIEVGANVGYFTRLFSMIVAPHGHVFAFEPISQTREILQKNLNASFSNVTVLPYAASDHPGPEVMFIPGDIHGQAALRSHDSGGWGVGSSINKEDVICQRIDDVPELKTVSVIDFMKIDAEGAELPVLKGAESLLLRDHPVLHLELESAWMKSFGYTQDDLETYLRKIDYHYFYVYNTALQKVDSLVSLTGVNLVCSQSSLL